MIRVGLAKAVQRVRIAKGSIPRRVWVDAARARLVMPAQSMLDAWTRGLRRVVLETRTAPPNGRYAAAVPAWVVPKTVIVLRVKLAWIRPASVGPLNAVTTVIVPRASNALIVAAWMSSRSVGEMRTVVPAIGVVMGGVCRIRQAAKTMENVLKVKFAPMEHVFPGSRAEMVLMAKALKRRRNAKAVMLVLGTMKCFALRPAGIPTIAP